MPNTYLHDIDPIALGLPFWPHGIHWYGLMYLLGFGVAWWLGNRRVAAGRLPGVNARPYGGLVFSGIHGVLVGGRVRHVLSDWELDHGQPRAEVLRWQESGLQRITLA